MPNKYAVSSTHAIDLASGRVAAPGESVQLSDAQVKKEDEIPGDHITHPHNAALIEAGVLVEHSTGRKVKSNGGN